MRGKGFTLLELAVVVAVVVILATVALRSFGRYVARVRLRLFSMTLVQDLRDMQAEAICAQDYHTIVLKTSENRYYYRPGAKSSVPAGVIPTERLLDQSTEIAVPPGKRCPVSAVFGLQTSKQSAIVTMSFNSVGRRA